MSVEKLEQYLIENPDEIVKILEMTDFHSISFSNSKEEIRCAYYEGGNPTSVAINCKTLQSYIFSKGMGGSLFYVIGLHNNWNLNQTINNITKILNIKNLEDFVSPYIFNGIYKKIEKKSLDEEDEILPDDLLNNFVDHPNVRFFKDNISYETQFKFNVRYDETTNRIVVPWRNKNGKLVGITGRYNFNDLGKYPKWKALKNFSKGNFLYGIFENYEGIKNAGYVLIGESEKFVMQLDTMGYHNALALGNCTITEKQARLIKSLPVEKIILALDEGVNVEHLLAQCEKLKGGIFNNNKEVWCIYDSKGDLLKKGSKNSPSDLGKEKFEKLLKDYCFEKE